MFLTRVKKTYSDDDLFPYDIDIFRTGIDIFSYDIDIFSYDIDIFSYDIDIFSQSTKKDQYLRRQVCFSRIVALVMTMHGRYI